MNSRPSTPKKSGDTKAESEQVTESLRDPAAADLSLRDAERQHPDERGRELIREARQLLEAER